MKRSGSLEFAQARIGARRGRCADEALWQRLETTRDLAGVLEIAHGGGLAPWVEGLAATAAPQAIEQQLQRRWVEQVHELADWMPPAWHDAVAWCAVLVELPRALHGARGQAAPAGLDADPQDRASPAGPAARSALAMERAALLEHAASEPGPLLDAWLAAWRRCAPAGGDRAEIERQFATCRARHVAALSSSGADAPTQRRALQARLVLLLRRATLQPLAAFVHLALLALEMQRLRAELVGRAAFPRRVPAPHAVRRAPLPASAAGP